MNAKFKPKGGSISPLILEQASEWQARLWSEDVTVQDQEACMSWRHAHPEHERAWQFIHLFDQQFQHLSDQQQNILLDRPLGDLASLIKKGGMLCLVLGLTYFVHQQQYVSLWFADYTTQAGEVKNITLSDGTTLILDSNSAVDIDFDQNERDIYLLKGQIFVKTGHQYNDLPPLHVHYFDVEIQPLGTQFTVANRQKNMQIGVYEGRVQIKSDKINPPLVLESGWQVRFNPDQPQLYPQKTDDLQLAWIDHKLIVEQMPICEFMQHLSTYRTGYIHCNSGLKNIKISGTYDLKQHEQILAELPHVLPLKIQHFTPYLISISADQN